VARSYGGLLAKGSSLRQPSSSQSPFIEAHWQARFGNQPFTRQQRQEIVEITEFSCDELLQPAVLYAPLYA
jgi:hypothetical protein